MLGSALSGASQTINELILFRGLQGIGVGTTTSLGVVTINMIVVGVGIGLLQPVMTLAVQNAIPIERLGVGTGAITYLRTTGSTVGTAVLATMVANYFFVRKTLTDLMREKWSRIAGTHKTSWACSASLSPILDQKVSFLTRHSIIRDDSCLFSPQLGVASSSVSRKLSSCPDRLIRPADEIDNAKLSISFIS